MARLSVESPPMNGEMPTIPSLPTTAISADAPSAGRVARSLLLRRPDGVGLGVTLMT
jgi:hypothetical protein